MLTILDNFLFDVERQLLCQSLNEHELLDIVIDVRTWTLGGREKAAIRNVLLPLI